MSKPPKSNPIKTPQNAKEKLLNAALHTIREKGYAGTSVDDLCAAAGVTKGAFFHHFKSKEHLAIAAAGQFQARAVEMFDAEPHRKLSDPVERLLGYIRQRKKGLRGKLPEYTCLLGTMVQETYETHPAIRKACNKAMLEHMGWLEADIREAMVKYRIKTGWSAKSLAAHIVSVIQGGFILAKAQYNPAIAVESLEHLRRYIEMIFARPAKRPIQYKGVAR